MSSLGPAASGNEFGARCVLWHAPGANPPADLLRALARRGFRVRAVQGQYAALAELCLLERGPVPEEGSRHFVLLMIEPDALEGREAILAAMRRYASRAVAWVYEAGANKPLRELVEPVAARPSSDRPASCAVASPVELRLAGEGPEPLALGAGLDPGEDRSDTEGHAGNGLGHLLSDEELAMLLDEPGPRAGGSADVD